MTHRKMINYLKGDLTDDNKAVIIRSEIYATFSYLADSVAWVLDTGEWTLEGIQSPNDVKKIFMDSVTEKEDTKGHVAYLRNFKTENIKAIAGKAEEVVRKYFPDLKEN